MPGIKDALLIRLRTLTERRSRLQNELADLNAQIADITSEAAGITPAQENLYTKLASLDVVRIKD